MQWAAFAACVCAHTYVCVREYLAVDSNFKNAFIQAFWFCFVWN